MRTVRMKTVKMMKLEIKIAKKIYVVLKENKNSEKLRMKKENSYDKLQKEVHSLKIKEEIRSGAIQP